MNRLMCQSGGTPAVAADRPGERIVQIGCALRGSESFAVMVSATVNIFTDTFVKSLGLAVEGMEFQRIDGCHELPSMAGPRLR